MLEQQVKESQSFTAPLSSPRRGWGSDMSDLVIHHGVRRFCLLKRKMTLSGCALIIDK